MQYHNQHILIKEHMRDATHSHCWQPRQSGFDFIQHL